MNCFIQCKMFGSDTRTIKAVVWQKLDGNFSLFGSVPAADTIPYSVVFPSLEVYVKGP